MIVAAAALLLALAPGGAGGACTGGSAAEATGRAEAPRVEVWLLGQSPPRALALRGGGRRLALSASGDRLLRDGRPVASPLELEEADWRLRPDGAPPRAYRAALRIRAEAGRLRVLATFDLERYVAAVVASEGAPGTPPAALQALAVVIRSYALAAAGRHLGEARCDLAHCQVLRGAAGPGAEAAQAAARATEGVVLRLPSGAVAAAPFHAACGGHTADPALAFGGEGTGAAAAEDPGCPPRRWRARLSPVQVAAALHGALDAAGWPAPADEVVLRAGDLVWSAGPAGWLAQVASPGGGWRLSGDAAVRALDAALGRGQVRSSRLRASDEQGWVVLRGEGHGHGVGLCQEGAARRARRGQGWPAILAAYFPGAAPGRLPSARTTPLAAADR